MLCRKELQRTQDFFQAVLRGKVEGCWWRTPGQLEDSACPLLFTSLCCSSCNSPHLQMHDTLPVPPVYLRDKLCHHYFLPKKYDIYCFCNVLQIPSQISCLVRSTSFQEHTMERVITLELNLFSPQYVGNGEKHHQDRVLSSVLHFQSFPKPT